MLVTMNYPSADLSTQSALRDTLSRKLWARRIKLRGISKQMRIKAVDGTVTTWRQGGKKQSAGTLPRGIRVTEPDMRIRELREI